MVKKIKKDSSESGSSSSSSSSAASAAAQLSGTVKESASQIWLAGLGAFAKAQEEGGKVFEALVKEGVSLQRKTQSAAEGKLSEATNRMASMATDISQRASGQWDKLENIFEERVSRALGKLGVPSARDLSALNERLDDVERRMAGRGSESGVAAKKASAKKAPGKKAPAKKAPAKKSSA